MKTWFRALSLGFGIAGLTKIFATPSQRRLFRSWGWPDDLLYIIGGLELGGAALMTSRRTRHIGAAAVAATSIAVLAAEIEHGQDALVTTRTAMLLGAITALL